MPRLGIGVVTYNRREILLETLSRIRRLTSDGDALIAVADDGSTDGTPDAVRALGIPVAGGVNRGIAWNKNRALYLLSAVMGCDAVLLLEDDVHPDGLGWERPWVEGAARWGHLNWAAPWIADRFVSGAGTPQDPTMCSVTSAQCAVFSAKALRYAGYFDPRFRGFGHEHVEHSRRMIRCGYGGTDHVADGREQVLFAMLDGRFSMARSESFFDAAQVDANLAVAHGAMGDRLYRAPWRDEAEMALFRDEMRPPARAEAGWGARLRRMLGGG